MQQRPLIDRAALEQVEAHVADAIAKGAKVETGSHRPDLGGTFCEPTVVSGLRSGMVVAREETFGPVAPAFSIRTDDDASAAANSLEFGLVAYFSARDVGRILTPAERLDYGRVGVNVGLMTTEVAPSGGVKQSGYGREGSHHGIDVYLTVKFVCIGL